MTIALVLTWILATATQAEEQPIGILLAAGDIVTCSKDAIRNGKATAALVSAEIKAAQDKYPGIDVRILALGDLAYPHGESFKCFDQSWGAFRKITFPVPGNHDYETPGASAYFKYFGPTLKALKADKDLATYTLEFPGKDKLKEGQKPWRLFALNSNKSTGDQAAQVKWLETELKKVNGKQCILAFAHAFFYSSGRHGHNDGHGKPQNDVIDITKPLLPGKEMSAMFKALHANHASVFLAGHDHHYEQLGRAGSNASPDDKGKAAIADDGVRSFVVGTGGKRLYSDDYHDKWEFSEAIDLSSYGILRLELYSASYKWKFIPTQDNSSMKVIKQIDSDRCNLTP